MADDRPRSKTSRIPIQVWNDLIDMRAWWKRFFAMGRQSESLNIPKDAAHLVCFNDTASTLSRGHVVKTGDTILDDITDRWPLPLVCSAPAEDGTPIAVTVYACDAKDGSTRYSTTALAHGVGLAVIDIQKIWHRRAKPASYR